MHKDAPLHYGGQITYTMAEMEAKAMQAELATRHDYVWLGDECLVNMVMW